VAMPPLRLEGPDAKRLADAVTRLANAMSPADGARADGRTR
jgi:hypothetical protein